MKNTFILFIIVMIAQKSRAQEINWKNFTDDKIHIANAQAGWDYGMSAGIGYAQKLKTKLPIVLNIQYSSAFGKNIFDDFKTKMGAQSALLNMHHFAVSVKAFGIFRRYENELVRLLNFGCEFSATAGYYKNSWYAAMQFGFDKAIVTHIKNTDVMKNNYPGVQDGWYIPTGGNFFYGIVSGYSFRHNDLYLKIGKTVSQDFSTAPALPYYLQLGINRRF